MSTADAAVSVGGGRRKQVTEATTDALHTAAEAVCVGGGRLTEVTEGDDRGDGSVGGDDVRHTLSTAAAAVCVGGGRLMEVIEAMEVSEVAASQTLWPLLLLSVSVEAD